MKSDPLHDIFKKYLNDIDPDKDGVTDLVHNVVSEYILILMGKGNIPHYLLDQLETDIREEVVEIYRKMTYGHLTLKSFKDAQASRAKKVKAS